MLLYSSFSMSPFKVSLCCLVHETVFSEIFPEDLGRQVFLYVLDQVDKPNPNSY